MVVLLSVSLPRGALVGLWCVSVVFPSLRERKRERGGGGGLVALF